MSECSNSSGISLLEAVGKHFAKNLVNRLQSHIYCEVIPDSQCGYRTSRSTMHMIFTAQQVVEKSNELCPPLSSLRSLKAFDVVNRNALWTSLRKLG